MLSSQLKTTTKIQKEKNQHKQLYKNINKKKNTGVNESESSKSRGDVNQVFDSFRKQVQKYILL